MSSQKTTACNYKDLVGKFTKLLQPAPLHNHEDANRENPWLIMVLLYMLCQRIVGLGTPCNDMQRDTYVGWCMAIDVSICRLLVEGSLTLVKPLEIAQASNSMT